MGGGCGRRSSHDGTNDKPLAGATNGPPKTAPVATFTAKVLGFISLIFRASGHSRFTLIRDYRVEDCDSHQRILGLEILQRNCRCSRLVGQSESAGIKPS